MTTPDTAALDKVSPFWREWYARPRAMRGPSRMAAGAPPHPGPGPVTRPARRAAAATAEETVRVTLGTVVEDVAHRARWTIGYPCARTDALMDWGQLDPVHRAVVNEVGDPWDDDRQGFTPNVRLLERAVVARAARWFRAPADYWGYVAHSGSEAIGQGLWCARAALPDGVVYYSAAAHMGVARWVEILGLPSVVVDVTAGGAMDVADLARRVDPHRPVIVAATAGTTMTEAVDDVAAIHAALDEAQPGGARYVHLDAALAGITLGVHPQASRWQQVRMTGDDGPGADSVSVSTHKFLGTPSPGGVFLTAAGRIAALRRTVQYLNSHVATIACSRNGHAVLQAWLALTRYPDPELHRLAQQCRRTARWLHGQLRAVGAPACRHADGLTVWLPAPSAPIRERYGLAVSAGAAHVVCVPGVDEDVLRQFVADVRADLWAAR